MAVVELPGPTDACGRTRTSSGVCVNRAGIRYPGGGRRTHPNVARVPTVKGRIIDYRAERLAAGITLGDQYDA